METQNLARNSFGITMALDSFTLELKLLLAQIEFLEDKVETLEAAIDQALTEVCNAERATENEENKVAKKEKLPWHVLGTTP